MTSRDEHRNACIEAMDAAVNPWLDGFSDVSRKLLFTAAFDGLHGIVFVEPLEATEEMVEAGERADRHLVENIYNAMSAAGDLTNGPEGGTQPNQYMKAMS